MRLPHHLHRRPALLLALAALLAGCFGPRKDQRRHYTLDLSLPPRGALQHKGRVRVRDLDVSRVYDRPQMILRRSDVEVHYCANRLWAERPHQLISDQLAAWLDAEGIFSAVSRTLGDRPPAWELAGRVDAFEINEREGKWEARLALSLELRRFADGAVLWRHRFDAREPVGSRDHARAARALSRLLARALREAVASLREAKGGRALTDRAARR